jgi:hypothetical protein
VQAVGGFDAPHVALYPRLPPDAKIAERLRIAHLAVSPELGYGQCRIADYAGPLDSSRRPERPSREAIVTT